MTGGAVGAFTAALRSMAPATVRVGARRIDARDLARMHEPERRAVSGVAIARQHEFATGRALLRELLRRDVSIAVRADRLPDLPTGVNASLAHDDQFAVAALTEDPSIAALGVDLEIVQVFEPDLDAIILRPDEHGLDASLVFTLKEAAFKAWSGGGGRLLEHHDVRVAVDRGCFRAVVLGAGAVFDGCYRRVEGRWLALVVVSTEPNLASRTETAG